MSSGAFPPSDRPGELDPSVSYLAEERVKRSENQFTGGGGSPPTDIDRRLASLERSHEKLEGKIDKLTELIRDFVLKTSERLSAIEGRITGIEKTLESKAIKSDLTPIEAKLGVLEGKISNLPNTPAMITLVLAAVGLSLGGAAGLAFTLFKIFKP